MNNVEIFTNYELAKLVIPYPTLQNLGLLLIFLIIAVLTRQKVNTVFLDRAQTEQLKGIAILLVVLGHLWVHVSSGRAIPVLGDYAVSLFLMISGYGLSISQTLQTVGRTFFLRRFWRVIIPYWLTTLLILSVDFLLLNRVYSLTDIMLTFTGFNLSINLKRIDYTRWFITLLLIYYVAYFLFNRFFNKTYALFGICTFALVLIILNISNIFHIGTVEQIIAFPIGCLIAFYYRHIFNFFYQKRNKLFICLPFILISCLFLLPSYNSECIIFRLLLYGMQIANTLLFCFLLILLVSWAGKLGYVSRFLSFCGLISYEIYLIHGPLLIKYNPIIKLFSPGFILISFLLFLSFILILAYCIHEVLKPLTHKYAS